MRDSDGVGEIAQQWDAERYDRDFSFVSALGDVVVSWLDPQPGERVLDLGCGSGDLTTVLVDAGAQVVGMDADPAMVARFRERHPDLPVVRADAQQPFPPAEALAEPFDAVFSNAALHWMPEADAVAAGVAAALRPGGRFVAELGGVGNVAVVQGSADGAAAALGLPAPRWQRYYPSPAQYATVLERAGLQVRRLELVDRPTPLNGPDGLADWYALFGAGALAHLAEIDRRRLVAGAVEQARASLLRDGQWWADYRRLRVLAVKA